MPCLLACLHGLSQAHPAARRHMRWAGLALQGALVALCVVVAATQLIGAAAESRAGATRVERAPLPLAASSGLH